MRADTHQIASVDSEFILPTVTYIGDKLRHPFRIYADEKGSLYVIVCEAPLMPDGIRSIMDLVVSWAINNGISEVITLDGIPVNGWPAKNRESIVLTSHSDNQRQQQSSLPSAPSSSGDDNNNDDDNNELKSSLSPSYHHKKTTLITGMSAGLLSSCLSRDMACSAVLVPTASGVPGPEGAALLLQTISEMPNIPLELDVNPLLKEGKEIKRRLAETIASLRQQEEAQTAPYPAGRSMMYG
ncbi:MAG TPA: PAC2 family protein [Chitinophagaceae bacterium]|nr:PAC2 family protein [Chitinophagaceae bacterium]